MNTRRAQDLLRHIIQDKDFGASMIKKISVSESIYLLGQILPDCVKKARQEGNENDIGFFSEMILKYRPIVLEKIKNSERLWIPYCESTGYPYLVDGDMMVLFDYAHHDEIEMKLNAAGFEISFLSVNALQFKNEIAHMYRNGYQRMRLIDGRCEPFYIDREELFPYEEFFKEDYMTNPGLEREMILFFQEFRKKKTETGREELLKKWEDAMLSAMVNAEYMVPCIKEETEDEIEVQHPFIDLSDQLEARKEGESLIAIPAFTDGFEMDKCYQGHHENMLYRFEQLRDLVEELEVSGIIINALGISYFLHVDKMNQILHKFSQKVR